MDPDRKTDVTVGVLFIAATVASIAGAVVLGSALDGPDYLAGLADQGGQVIVASLLFLVAATSAFGTAVLLFPTLRPYAEGLAAGYVGLRAFENVLYVIGSVGLLSMLTVSQSETIRTADPAAVTFLGTTLLAIQSWSVAVGTLIFAGLGSLVLNAVLFRSGLVPRWLSAWGVIGAAGVFAYGVLGVLGFGTDLGSPLMLLAMPTAVQEMVFAGWLIARGLRRSEPSLQVGRPPRIQVAA